VQEVLKPGEARLLSIGSVENGTQGRAGMYRGAEFHFRRPKVRLEIAVDDGYAESAVAQIVRTVITGESEQVCDDTVYMMPLDACFPSVNDLRRMPRSEERHLLVARCTLCLSN